MKCATHHDVETSLACGRCGTPICPRCLVETPVGARCSKCANVKRLPTYQVSTAQYAKATTAGIAMAIVIGIAWAWLRVAIPYFAFGLTMSLLLGSGTAFAIAEVISRAINRKRGTPLQIVAGACFVLCYVVSNVWLSGHVLTFFEYFDWVDLFVLTIGVVITTARLR